MSKSENNSADKQEESILKKLKIRNKSTSPKKKIQSKENAGVISPPSADELTMVATCMQNLEEELAEELRQLGAKEIEVQRRAVQFKGDLELLYKANIWLRTALKVLQPLFHFRARNEDELYEKAKSLEWERIFSEEKTFSIDFAVHSEKFTHSQFAALRVKDAIVDRFRMLQKNRPNVEREDPDVRIHLHINQQDVTVSLDSSGAPLFKRGYRVQQHMAPINECLAAGLVLKSGWKGETDLLDPMCGTGTIAIEAALIACNIPPNLNRTRFAFEGWKNYDQQLLSKVLGQAKNEFRPLEVKIFARELNSNNLRSARVNVNAANMRRFIELEKADFLKAEAPASSGTIIMNPPYGERLSMEDEMGDFFNKIGSTLKHEYTGWTAWIITSDEESMKSIGLKPSAKIPMMNGKLECQFRKYELFTGKRVEQFN
jgi:putative N6-adenine-specific DNA methylase